MEVVKVRKQNNIGNFPNDWDVKTLGEISAIDSDNLGFNTKPDYKFMYVKLEDIDIGRLKGCSEMIFRDAPSRARRKVQKSDILISTVRPNLLSHFYFREEVHDFICSTGFSVIRCDHNIVDPAYVFFHLFGEIINKQINSTLIGSNYPAINSNDVRNLSLPIPPLPEQKAIAEALSDVDALIASLEALIAKKRAIKQGVMQELLTGKRRLPGYSGEWEIRKLGDVTSMASGGTPLTSNPTYYEGNIPWVVIADITEAGKYIEKTEKCISQLGLLNSSAKLFEEGTLLFAMYASIGKCSISKTKLTCNQAILGITPKVINIDYLYYFLQFKELQF